MYIRIFILKYAYIKIGFFNLTRNAGRVSWIWGVAWRRENARICNERFHQSGIKAWGLFTIWRGIGKLRHLYFLKYWALYLTDKYCVQLIDWDDIEDKGDCMINCCCYWGLIHARLLIHAFGKYFTLAIELLFRAQLLWFLSSIFFLSPVMFTVSSLILKFFSLFIEFSLVFLTLFSSISSFILSSD